MEMEGMTFHTSVDSLQRTEEYIRVAGDRRTVVLRVLAADSLHGACRMRELLLKHSRDDSRDWTIAGGEQLYAAGNLSGPVSAARDAALILLTRIAGGFSFGPVIKLAHGSIHVPHGDGSGPGGIGYSLFEDAHQFAFRRRGGFALGHAQAHGEFEGSIARALVHRFCQFGLTFADKAKELDAEGHLLRLRDCEIALRFTSCTPLHEEAQALAIHMRFVRRILSEFAEHFDDLRHLSLRRSHRRCRYPWVKFFDRCFVDLQQDRVEMLNRLQSLGVHIQRFMSQKIVFPSAPIG